MVAHLLRHLRDGAHGVGVSLEQREVERAEDADEVRLLVARGRRDRGQRAGDGVVGLGDELEPGHEVVGLFNADGVDRPPEVVGVDGGRVVRAGEVKDGLEPHVGVFVSQERSDLLGSEHSEGSVAGSGGIA